jgi:hypothetical protein
MDPAVSILIGNDETALHNASVFLGIVMQRYQADCHTDFEERPRGRFMTVTFASNEHAILAAQYLQNLATARGLFAMLISDGSVHASDLDNSHHERSKPPGPTS